MSDLTDAQQDLIRGAACGFLDYREGAFFRCHVQLPEIVAHECRELVFAGLLELDRQRVLPTTAGRLAVQAVTR